MLSEKEQRRQAQAEALRQHNKSLERLRMEKEERFNAKLNKVDRLKADDRAASK